MFRLMKAALVVAVAVGIAACGATTFQSTWKEPTAEARMIPDGTKILAMVVSGNIAKRRGFEAALVNELNEHGLEGIQANAVIPEDATTDGGKAKPFVQKSGADYAIVVQVTGQTQEITGTPSMYGGGMYGPGWGGWGWGWGGGTDIRTDTRVGVQTLLFDVKADKLIWAGQSETMNPTKAESFMRDLLRAVGDQLHKDGLVTEPKRT
jgi:hypothetical protein